MFDTSEPTLTDPRQMATEHLEAEACTLASAIAAATCRWLLVVAELDRRETWRSWGCRGMGHWLSWKCGVAPVTARHQLIVARKLPGLPRITAEFVAGALSYSKVRALVRVATRETETELITLAHSGTAAHLERMINDYERALALAAEGADTEARNARGMWFRGTVRNTYQVRLELTAEQYEVFKTRIKEMLEEIPADTCADARDPAAARRLDALERIVTGPDPAQLNIHVHTELDHVIAAELPAGESGPAGPLAARNADARRRAAAQHLRRIGCDAQVRLAIDQAGATIDLGRTRRHPNRRLRRGVLRRDRHRCRWAACEHRAEHVHHVIPWIDGGPTDLANLCGLCRYHHRMCHPGGWTIHGDANEPAALMFTDGARAFGERPDPLPPATIDDLHEAHGRLDPNGVAPKYYDGPCDHDLAVTALICLLLPSEEWASNAAGSGPAEASQGSVTMGT